MIGICGSGSFAVSAAKIDPRMKAIATVSMYDMGAVNRHALNKSQTLAQREAIIAESAQQRYVEFAGGETKYTSGTVQEITERSNPTEREFYDFYRDRVSLIPWAKLTAFFSQHLAQRATPAAT